MIIGIAEWALGLLELTLGRPDEATDRLLGRQFGRAPRVERADRAVVGPRPDRSGGARRKARRSGRSNRPLHGVGTALVLTDAPVGVRRSRALVGEGDLRERFEKALATRGAISPFQQARTELLYGEWLRRERQRREARQHLRRAAELFRQVGAPPWAERAEGELRATGETARRRDPSTLDDLTPQELQIAALVADGHDQSADRRAAVPQPAHDRLPPAQGLQQARRGVPHRARAHGNTSAGIRLTRRAARKAEVSVAEQTGDHDWRLHRCLSAPPS